MKSLQTICISLVVIFSCTTQENQINQGLSLFDLQRLGTVEFSVSCPSVEEQLEHGVALLHHMMYNEADLLFQSIIEQDPNCPMGYWGRAMSIIHPAWPDTPSKALLDSGKVLVEMALNKSPGTDRELAYIETIRDYFINGNERSEQERLIAFREGWKKIHERYPEDLEAAAFNAVSIIAMIENDIGDRDEQKILALEEMRNLLNKVPDHPGGLHYTIHAYDYMAPDDWGLEVANRYAKLTPDVPHALHMPTHIFNSLGYWTESIELNKRSALAAWEQGHLNKGLDNHYPHALGYLIYAYLQRGDDEKAARFLNEATSIEGPYSDQNRLVMAAHLASIPVRYALERHDWQEASKLPLRQANQFPWEEKISSLEAISLCPPLPDDEKIRWSGGFTQFDAVTYFARTIGNARLGNLQIAQQSLDSLEWIVSGTATWGSPCYIIRDKNALVKSAKAWVYYANNQIDEAIRTMTEASQEVVAALELGPGELYPVSEQLADMYFDLQKYEEALESYQAVLEALPNRYNSFWGAGKSAEMIGDNEMAKKYFQELVEMVDDNCERESLMKAKLYLASNKSISYQRIIGANP